METGDSVYVIKNGPKDVGVIVGKLEDLGGILYLVHFNDGTEDTLYSSGELRASVRKPIKQ